MGIYSKRYYSLIKIIMPNKDKTGPEGKGPKTGRGQGTCEEGSQVGRGRGGVGRGQGRNVSSNKDA